MVFSTGLFVLSNKSSLCRSEMLISNAMILEEVEAAKDCCPRVRKPRPFPMENHKNTGAMDKLFFVIFYISYFARRILSHSNPPTCVVLTWELLWFAHINIKQISVQDAN